MTSGAENSSLDYITIRETFQVYLLIAKIISLALGIQLFFVASLLVHALQDFTHLNRNYLVL